MYGSKENVVSLASLPGLIIAIRGSTRSMSASLQAASLDCQLLAGAR